jgi:hypothetical protein
MHACFMAVVAVAFCRCMCGLAAGEAGGTQHGTLLAALAKKPLPAICGGAFLSFYPLFPPSVLSSGLLFF